MKNSAALLIIDMQKGSFTPATPRFDTPGVVYRINELSGLFREKNLPVIIIQHDGSKENEYLPGTSEWELLDEIIVKPADILVSKTANDCFYKSDLSKVLDNLKVKHLYITGCATDFCVEATIQSALVKDYDITVVKDGHTTASRSHIEAEMVIEHFNWVWQNLVPTQGKIEVVEFKKIVQDGIY